jgi:hypothetical protein
LYYIWIDQDFIDQTNEAFKELAIRHTSALYTWDDVLYLLDIEIKPELRPLLVS